MAIENGGASPDVLQPKQAPAPTGSQDSLSEYRSPAKSSGEKEKSSGAGGGGADSGGGSSGTGGGTSSVFHMNDAFPHPKTTEQAVWESRSIEMNANAALHSNDAKAAAAEFQRITDTLKGMTPSERALMFKQLQTIGDAIQDSGQREPNRHGLPDVIINRDEKGDVKDITFKSVSDDDAYGKSFKINMTETNDAKSKDANKETDLGKEQTNKYGDKFTLDKDGRVSSYQYINKDGKVEQSFQFGRDADGNINKITMKNGDVYEKLPKDPESWDINERNGTGWSVSNPETGMIGRSSAALGDVTANGADGVHVDIPGGANGRLGYSARNQLGITKIEHKKDAE